MRTSATTKSPSFSPQRPRGRSAVRLPDVHAARKHENTRRQHRRLGRDQSHRDGNDERARQDGDDRPYRRRRCECQRRRILDAGGRRNKAVGDLEARFPRRRNGGPRYYHINVKTAKDEIDPARRSTRFASGPTSAPRSPCWPLPPTWTCRPTASSRWSFRRPIPIFNCARLP